MKRDDYLKERLLDEFAHEVQQDIVVERLEVVATFTSEFWGIVKGQVYISTQSHWRNGEGHFVIEGLGEKPDRFFEPREE